MAEVDFRVKNGLVVGTNATITGTITASTFVGDGSGITGATASYDSLTGTVPTWNQNTTGTASGLSATLAVASGGTGVTSSTGTGSVVLSASPTFTGTVSGITAAMVGLGNVTNNAAVANLSGTNTGDQILPTTLPASDVYTWAKEATKPTYTASEVGLGNVDNTTDLLKPISTATQTALDFKSPLDSPTFTGTPSVPTATAGTNTTQIASTAYVRAEVAALVASAPTALDTLNELATALGNDANFSTTVTTALGLKAPLASPTFTGTVSGITKSMVGLGNVDNTTDLLKPISTATQTALDLKSPLASPTFTGVVTAPNSLLKVTTSSYPTIRPSLNLDFANSQSVDPRITFTRASTATRVRQDGLIEVVASGSPRIDFDPVTQVCKGLLIEEQRTNLLTYSENFDSAVWTKPGGATCSSNVLVSPDGTVNADKLVEFAGFANQSFEISTTLAIGTSCAISIYAKAAERTQFRFAGRFSGSWSSFPSARIDLSSGTVLNSTGNITATVQSVGNGWYRCTVYGTTSGTNAGMVVSPLLSGGTTSTYTGDGVSGIYIWGAQLEAGSFATSYIPSSDTFTSRASTATYVGSNGLIQSALTNVARYNYNPVNLALAPKLLLESASTNLLTYSEQFDNAAWARANATVTANATTAPDGTLTADKLVESAINSGHYIQMGVTTATNIQQTFSFYVKAAEKNNNLYIQIYDSVTANVLRITLDIASKTIVSSSNSGTASSVVGMVSDIGNGWLRVAISGIPASENSGSLYACRIALLKNDNSTLTYTGDGTSGIYIWGAQLEASSFPTSYIPTVASQVTRAADISSSAQTTRVADTAVMTGTNFSSWYNQTEGTVLCNFIPKGSVASRTIWDLHNQSSAEYIELRYSSGSALQYDCADNSIEQWNIAPTGYSSLNTRYSHAASYKINDIAASVNGSSVFTDSSASLCTPTKLSFGISYNLVSENLNGHISKLSYYPKRLTNSELQALTTG